MDNPVEDIPRVFVLDGGFSTQLSTHVGSNIDGNPLWSARFLQTNPEEVMQSHLDFLRAGADVIMTNTYQASVGGFVKHLGVTPEEGYSLIRRAVDLAKQAREVYLKELPESDSGRVPKIAGSIGPYGAHLNDGSEYNGHYANKTAAEVIKEWHLPHIKTLVECGVDLLAFETIPCQIEGETLVELLKDFPTMKAWISFSCKDGKCIANGEDYQTAARKCWDANPTQLIAVGVNCCSPLHVSSLLGGINDDRKYAPIPLITYPNSGEKFSVEEGWTEKDKCAPLHTFVYEWLDLGVRYIGGCCRTYAADISNIKTEVQKWCNSANL